MPILLQEQLDEMWKNNFSRFIGKTLQTVDPSTRYADNWHIDLIAQQLEAARKAEITRLIINMPPRALKSTCVSVAWPAWLLAHDPCARIMAASYSERLSIRHSLDCRMIVTSPWYRRLFPGVQLAHDQNEKYKFMTTERGFRFATSVGGTITGEGGNFLIIDDPINPTQAANEIWREHVNRWFDHTFSTRLNDKQKGVIVLVMQRLHENDLTGHLLSKGGWKQLSLPAVATAPEDYIIDGEHHYREINEPLHPHREDIMLIERARIDLGSHAFAAQYQQQPMPDEGGMARPYWFGRYKSPPESEGRRVQSWDTAIKSGAQHDASVCLTFAEHEGKSYLLDAQVMRHEYPDLKRAFYKLAKQWRPQAILIEDRASGQQLLQDVHRDSHLPVIAMQPKKDKITRFAAISAMLESGRVALPEQASWLAGFEGELFAFPAGTHDDQVDALTQYLDWLRGMSWERLGIRSL